MVDRVRNSSSVGDTCGKSDDALNSAASTLASIVSRQAFDIPRTDGDSSESSTDDDIGSSGGRRSAGGRFSLPEIVGPGDGVGSGVRARRDSVGSGVRARRDTQAIRGRDPFGSPVTPKTYDGFRYRAANARVAADVKTAAALS